MGHELQAMGGGSSLFLRCAHCTDLIYNGAYRCRKCIYTCHRSCVKSVYTRCLADVTGFTQWEDLTSRLMNNSKPHTFENCMIITKYCCHCGQMIMPGSVKEAFGIGTHNSSSEIEARGLSQHSNINSSESLDIHENHGLRCSDCAISVHKECRVHVPEFCGMDRKTASAIVNQYRQEARGEVALFELKCGDNLIPPDFGHSIAGTIEHGHKNESIPGLMAQDIQERFSIEREYEMISVLGKGNFGKVMMAKEYSTGELVALKVLKKSSIEEDDGFDNLRNECAVFASIHSDEVSKFLVKCRRIITTAKNVIFVMEYVAGGDLMFHIQRMGSFDEPWAKFYAAQTLLALESLHNRNIIYRDLKLDNILLTLDGNVKLADYGLSKVGMTEHASTRTFCGTTEFMAPEVILEQSYTRAIDWWAFGVLLYELLYSRPPFHANREKDIFKYILNSRVTFDSRTKVSLEAKDLICRLLIRQPSVRLTDPVQIKKHPFFDSIDFDRLARGKIIPPYKPIVESDVDVRNFDRDFTSEKPVLTPCASKSTSKIDQILSLKSKGSVEEDEDSFYDAVTGSLTFLSE